MPYDPHLRLRAEAGLRRVRRAVVLGFAISAFLFILAIPAFIFEARFVHDAVRTRGQVTKIVPEDSLDRVSYSFVDAHGGKHRGTSSGSRGAYKVNDPVNVLYLPSRPARSEIAGFWNQWILAAACFGACLAMLPGTFFLRSYARKYRQRLDALESGS